MMSDGLSILKNNSCRLTQESETSFCLHDVKYLDEQRERLNGLHLKARRALQALLIAARRNEVLSRAGG